MLETIRATVIRPNQAIKLRARGETKVRLEACAECPKKHMHHLNGNCEEAINPVFPLFTYMNRREFNIEFNANFM